MAIDKITTGGIADNAVTTIKIADSTGAADGITTAKLHKINKNAPGKTGGIFCFNHFPEFISLT